MKNERPAQGGRYYRQADGSLLAENETVKPPVEQPQDLEQSSDEEMTDGFD